MTFQFNSIHSSSMKVCKNFSYSKIVWDLLISFKKFKNFAYLSSLSESKGGVPTTKPCLSLLETSLPRNLVLVGKPGDYIFQLESR